MAIFLAHATSRHPSPSRLVDLFLILSPLITVFLFVSRSGPVLSVSRFSFYFLLYFSFSFPCTFPLYISTCLKGRNEKVYVLPMARQLKKKYSNRYRYINKSGIHQLQSFLSYCAAIRLEPVIIIIDIYNKNNKYKTCAVGTRKRCLLAISY